MRWVVFLRAVNVGGTNRCQPASIAKQLAKFGDLNIGTVGFRGQTSPPDRIQQSTKEILKFEANLAKVLLGFEILEGSDDFLQRKTAVDNGFQTIGRYRPNHVLLICSAANGDPADTNLIRKQCRDRHFSRKTSQDAD